MTSAPRAFAPLDLLQLVAIAVIWGVNNVAAKIAVDAIPPLAVAALRFGVVLIVLAPWLFKPLPKGAWKPMLAMVTLVGPLHFGVQYIGLAWAHDLAPMIVAMQLWAPFSVLFAAIFLRERVGVLRWIGLACAFLGVASMSFDPVVFAQVPALSLVVFASSCYAMGTVLVRRMPSVDAWTMQAWLALAVAPTTALMSAFAEQGQVEAALHAGWLAWAAILFGALASSLGANFFMFRLVQIYEVSRTTPYLLLSPLIAFTLSAIVLHDRITLQILGGAAATIVGVALVALAERQLRALAKG